MSKYFIELKKYRIINLSAVLFALLIWHIISTSVGLTLLIPSPFAVLKKLHKLLHTKEFYIIIGLSSIKILTGFLLAFLSAFLLAFVAYKYEWFMMLIKPYILMIKSVPVASFIIIALLWLHKSYLAVLISFLIVLPLIYQNILSSLNSIDIKMLEFAYVYKLNAYKKFIYIYLPALKPYICAASSTAIGMAWKAGVAAELIGTPNLSVGKMLYEAKIYLESDTLFAWTLVIVILSYCFEKLLLYIIKCLYILPEKLC